MKGKVKQWGRGMRGEAVAHHARRCRRSGKWGRRQEGRKQVRMLYVRQGPSLSQNVQKGVGRMKGRRDGKGLGE